MHIFLCIYVCKGTCDLCRSLRDADVGDASSLSLKSSSAFLCWISLPFLGPHNSSLEFSGGLRDTRYERYEPQDAR